MMPPAWCPQGIIAVEFARIFAELRADVTMVVRASDLPSSLGRVGIDRQIGFLLQAELVASGVKLLFESEVTSAESVVGVETAGGQRRKRNEPDQLELQVSKTGTADGRSPLRTDLVLTATGRRAITDGLGLDTLGIELKPNGDVEVDSTLMTTAEGVYAAGDLIGAPQLASTGIEQAEAAVDAMLGRSTSSPTAGSVAGLVTRDCSPAALLSNAARYPIGIWTMPELAFVGLTAAAASAEPHNLDVVEGLGRYSDSIRGHVHTVGTDCEGEYLGCHAEAIARGGGGSGGGGSDAQAVGTGTAATAMAGAEAGEAMLTGPALKLVVERCEPHRVVGVHILGDNACELIHFGTTLVQGGKTLSDILAVCYAAVTYHELFKLAARDAIATLQKDEWRELYRRLDAAGDNNGTLEAEEVRTGLEELGADEEAIADILKALFTGRDFREAVGVEQFVKRAMRMRSPMQMGLLGTCA